MGCGSQSVRLSALSVRCYCPGTTVDLHAFPLVLASPAAHSSSCGEEQDPSARGGRLSEGEISPAQALRTCQHPLKPFQDIYNLDHPAVYESHVEESGPVGFSRRLGRKRSGFHTFIAAFGACLSYPMQSEATSICTIADMRPVVSY